METSIRTLLLADMPSATPEVAAWLYREWDCAVPGGTPEGALLKLRARANAERLPMALLAVAEGKPLGTASLLATEQPEDEYGPWVSGVYVLPQHRRRRIATMLMCSLEQEAIRLGAARLLLSAGVPALYRHLGYKPTGAIKHGEPVMMKALGAVSYV